MEFHDSNLHISSSNISNYIAHTHINAQSIHLTDSSGQETLRLALQRSKKMPIQKTGEEKLLEIQEKLPFLNYLQAHDLASRKIVGDSGQWFLQLQSFEDWKAGKYTGFLGLGDPGVGKTCLVSLIISHLQSLGGPTRVAYFYLSHQVAESQRLSDIISTLVTQLLFPYYPSLPDSAVGLYNQLSLNQGLPQLKTLVTTLIDLCKDPNYRTYIILDALDECNTSYQAELLDIIEQLLTGKVQLLATSRPISQDIGFLFDTDQSTKYSIRAASSDIFGFLQKKLDTKKSLRSIFDVQFKKEVIQTIESRSKGVFLIAAMQIDYMLSLKNKSQIKEALSKFPSSLDMNYSQTITRIDAQSSDLSDMAWWAMKWLALVHQPFTAKALCYALATEPKSEEFDVDSVIPAELILESCHGLLVVVQGAEQSSEQVFTFCHLSAQEYIHRKLKPEIYSLEKHIAWTCLTYLTLNTIHQDGIITVWLKKSKSEDVDPFYIYAARYWGIHAKEVLDNELLDFIKLFLTKRDHVIKWAQNDYAKHTNNQMEDTSHVLLLHIVARFGFQLNQVHTYIAEDIVATINAKAPCTKETPLTLASRYNQAEIVDFILGIPEVDINAENCDNLTALVLAVRNGHEQIVTKLLNSANIDSYALHTCHKVAQCSTLHDAAERGYMSIVESLIAKGVNLLQRNESGWTALHIAAAFGQLPTVEFLVEKTGDSSQPDNNGWTTLYVVAQTGHLAIVEFLLNKGVDPCQARNNGWNALHLSAQNGHLAIVEFLASKGVDPAQPDNDGWTALHSAAQNNHLPVVQFLLGKGVNLFQQDKSGWTALHSAAQNGHLAIVELLVNKGADPSQSTNEGWTAFTLAAQNNHLPIMSFLLNKDANYSQIPRSDGWSALHSAAQNGHLTTIQFLLDKGVDPSQQRDDGWTALHSAAQNGHLAIVESLVDKGIDPAQSDHEGWTALHSAAQNNHLSVVKFLLDKGVNPSQGKNDGWTPFHLAAQNGHLPIVKVLLDTGVDPSHPNNNGWTALHAASTNGHLAIVKFLVDHGVDPAQPYKRSWTAIHSAAASGHLNIVKFLVDKGINPLQPDDDGWTPLHSAAEKGHLSIVEFLMEKGANPSQSDAEGETPLQLAIQNSHQDVVYFLSE